MLARYSETNRTSPALPQRVRWLLASAAAVLAVGLAVAARVEPDRRGYGTHEHLGLGPCTFRVLFNRPCPSCGMTTAWSCTAHGRPLRAFRANIGGALLAMAAMLAVPWLALSAVLGRWLFRPPPAHWIAIGASTLGIVTLLQWFARLVSAAT